MEELETAFRFVLTLLEARSMRLDQREREQQECMDAMEQRSADQDRRELAIQRRENEASAFMQLAEIEAIKTALDREVASRKAAGAAMRAAEKEKARLEEVIRQLLEEKHKQSESAQVAES